MGCDTENCSHNCESCAQKPQSPQDMREKPNQMSSVKKVIGVISGKGGVGKSTVTSLLAVMMQRAGYRTGVLDADITGPSIPKAFGIEGRAEACEWGLMPRESLKGTQVMSINLLLENESDPVIWRGPVIASAVKQFWTDVIWTDLDYLFVDAPPGTGDVPLTVFQSLPVDGVVIVATPQELVSMIVHKAVHMAQQMNIPILGVVLNMAYVECPDCGKKIELFGDGAAVLAAAEQEGIPILGRMPLDPGLSAACDRGEIELVEKEYLPDAKAALEALA